MKEKMIKTGQDNPSKELVLKLIEKVEITANVDNQIEQLHNLENDLIANQINNQQSIECMSNNAKIGIILENILNVRTIDEITDEFTCKIIREYQSQVTEEDRKLNYLLCDKSKESQTIIIKKFMQLVKKIANKYKGNGVEFDDLVSAGTLGLLKAIEKFEPNRNTKFMTFAFWWITSYISRENRKNSRVIRIPDNKYDILNDLNAYKRKFEVINNRVPTAEEIMDYFGYTELELQELNNLMVHVDSLDRKMNDDDDSRELGAVISDKNISIEEQYENKILSEELNQLFHKIHLTDKEIFVLTKRYGLQDQTPMLLEEIASLYNVSRQRISQIEQKALQKLRKSPLAQKFRVYIDTFSKSDDESVESKVQNQGHMYISNGKRNTCTNIYEMFSEYSKEEIDIALSKLPEHYKDIVYKKYGKELDGSNETKLTAQERSTFYHKIRKLITEYLKDPNYQYSEQNKNLFQRLNQYDEEAIRQAVSMLTKDEQELLYVKFGKNLDAFFKGSENINTKINYIVYQKLEQRCKIILGAKDISKENSTRKGRRSVTIHEMFPEYSKEEITLAVSKLPEHYKDIVYKKYGKELDGSNETKLTTHESSTFYHRIKNLITEYLKDPNYQYLGQNKNLFQRLNQYNEETIRQAVSMLTKDEQAILYLKFGENLDSCFKETKNINEKMNYIVYQKLEYRCKIILDIKDPSKENSKPKKHRSVTIYGMFPEYSKEEIDLVVSRLPEYYKEIVYKKYGNNLDGDCITELTPNERAKFYHTIKPLLINYLKDPNYQYLDQNKNLFQRLNQYNEETIRQAVAMLTPDEQELLYAKFGKNLDTCFKVSRDITKKVSYIVCQKLEHICKSILEKTDPSKEIFNRRGPRSLTIYDMFIEYSKEEITLAVSKLPEHYKDIVYKKYGHDLDEICATKLTTNESATFNRSIKPLILANLKDPNFQYMGRNKNLFKRLINYDEEIIRQAVEMLTIDEQELLYTKFGKNLDTCFKVSVDITEKVNYLVCQKLEHICRKILASKDPNQNNVIRKGRRILAIYEMFPEYSKEEIALAVSKLSEYHKEIVYKKYGHDLDGSCTTELTTKEKTKFYHTIKPLLKKYIENSDFKGMIRNENLFQRLSNYDEETINQAVAMLTLDEKELLYAKFGKNLDTCFKVSKDINTKFNRVVLRKLKYRCNNIIKGQAPSKSKKKNITIYEMFSKYPKEDIVNAISKLPEEFKKVIYTKYGMDLNNECIDALSEEETDLINGRIKPIILKYLTNSDYQYKPAMKDLNLFQRLNEYDEYTIRFAVKDLEQKAQEECYNKYGINLDGCFDVNIDEAIITSIKLRCKKINIITIKKADSENLFTIFPQYSKEEVKLAVSKIPADFKEIIDERYGADLENISYDKLSDDKKVKLYNHILPLILNYLTNPNYIYKKHRNANQNLYERLSDYEPSIIHESIQQLTNSQRDLLYRRYGKTFKECNRISSEEIDYINRGIIPMIIRKCKKLTHQKNELKEKAIVELINSGTQSNLNIDKTEQTPKEIYNEIDKLVSNPDFVEFVKALDLEDISLASVVIAFAYVNGTFTSLNELSHFLSVDRKVIKEIMKKILLSYKKYLNDELDSIIDNPFQKHLSNI